MFKKALKLIGFALIVAAWLWGFYLIQGMIAMGNYMNGYRDGFEAARPQQERTGIILPKGATEGLYFAQPTHSDNQ